MVVDLGEKPGRLEIVGIRAMIRLDARNCGNAGVGQRHAGLCIICMPVGPAGRAFARGFERLQTAGVGGLRRDDEVDAGIGDPDGIGMFLGCGGEDLACGLDAAGTREHPQHHLGQHGVGNDAVGVVDAARCGHLELL